MSRLSILCLALVMAVPAAAQTTGVPGSHDFTINGGGSGGTSMVATTLASNSMDMQIDGSAGAVVIGAISTAAPGSLPFGAGNSVDINLGSAQFFIDGTGGFITSPLNAFATISGLGSWGLNITANFPAGPLGAIQFGIVGPGYAAPAQLTQAHDVSALASTNNCGPLTNVGPTSDDTGILVGPFTNAYPFYGTAYMDAYLNPNGNVTFTGADSDFTSSEAEFLANNPKIAACWDDFSPNIAGTVTWEEDVAAGNVRFSWDQVPCYAATPGDSNSFCATIDVTGTITLNWDFMNFDGGTSTDHLVGISPGTALSGMNNIDMSATTAAPVIGSMNQALYEDFNLVAFGVWDLTYGTHTFTPATADSYVVN